MASPPSAVRIDAPSSGDAVEPATKKRKTYFGEIVPLLAGKFLQVCDVLAMRVVCKSWEMSLSSSAVCANTMWEQVCKNSNPQATKAAEKAAEKYKSRLKIEFRTFARGLLNTSSIGPSSAPTPSITAKDVYALVQLYTTGPNGVTRQTAAWVCPFTHPHFDFGQQDTLVEISAANPYSSAFEGAHPSEPFRSVKKELSDSSRWRVTLYLRTGKSVCILNENSQGRLHGKRTVTSVNIGRPNSNVTLADCDAGRSALTKVKELGYDGIAVRVGAKVDTRMNPTDPEKGGVMPVWEKATGEALQRSTETDPLQRSTETDPPLKLKYCHRVVFGHVHIAPVKTGEGTVSEGSFDEAQMMLALQGLCWN